jgi:hypothetical protein
MTRRRRLTINGDMTSTDRPDAPKTQRTTTEIDVTSASAEEVAALNPILQRIAESAASGAKTGATAPTTDLRHDRLVHSKTVTA